MREPEKDLSLSLTEFRFILLNLVVKKLKALEGSMKRLKESFRYLTGSGYQFKFKFKSDEAGLEEAKPENLSPSLTFPFSLL